MHGYCKSGLENHQTLTQLSHRSHQRQLVGKRTAQKDAIKDITSDSQVNSYFPYRWSPASLTVNIYFYLFLYLYIKQDKRAMTALGRSPEYHWNQIVSKSVHRFSRRSRLKLFSIYSPGGHFVQQSGMV